MQALRACSTSDTQGLLKTFALKRASSQHNHAVCGIQACPAVFCACIGAQAHSSRDVQPVASMRCAEFPRACELSSAHNRRVSDTVASSLHAFLRFGRPAMIGSVSPRCGQTQAYGVQVTRVPAELSSAYVRRSAIMVTSWSVSGFKP